MPDPRPSRQIHAAIRARIADGAYAPGDRVHVGLLADEFGVTRTTVGKALKLAEADGLVELFHGVGWYVKEPPALPALCRPVAAGPGGSATPGPKLRHGMTQCRGGSGRERDQ